MSYFEYSALPIHEKEKSRVSFEVMSDKIVDDDVDRTDNLSSNSEYFSQSPKDNDENDYENRAHDSIKKVSPNTEIFDVAVNTDMKQKDCHLISDYNENQIIPNENNFDICLSAQDSVCTECRFGNKQISFFSSFDNTQLQSQTNCFSSMINPIIDHGDKEDQYKKKDFDINMKRFDIQELGLRTFSQLSDYVGSPLDVSILDEMTTEKLQPLENIGNSPLKHTLQNIGKTLIVENNEPNCGSSNEFVTSISQNLNKTTSNCSYSSSSQNTIEEFYCIGGIDETGESINKVQETDSSKSSNSTFSGTTIEEVYFIDTTADVDNCSAISVKAMNKIPESEIAENNLVQRVIENEIIEDHREITGTGIITCFDQGILINPMPNEMNGKEANIVRETPAVNNRRTEDDVESEYRLQAETNLKKIETEDKITAKNDVSVHRIDDPAKDSECENYGGVSKVPDESFLEISLESEPEQFGKQERIAGKRKTNSTSVGDKLKTDISDSQNNREMRTVPIDLTIGNKNGVYDGNAIPSKADNMENDKTTISMDDFDTQLLSETQLKNIELQDEIAMKGISTPGNFTVDLGANVTTLIKDQNTLNGDDLSLDFLSESELKRIEEEAYMNTKEPISSTANSKLINAQIVVNERDVFYRSEQLNITTDESDKDLVMPNWVKNPAPEPDYNKMKRTVQMRRSYIKRMLQEILRLSTIVSKVGSIVYADSKHSNTGASLISGTQIEEDCPIPLKENKPSNQSSELGTHGVGEKNAYLWGNAVTKDSEDSDIFYVPKSSRLNYNAPFSSIIAATHTARINNNGPSVNSKESGKFYDPQANRSKYDSPPIFNRQSDAEFKKGNISTSYMQTNASNIFGSLKRDFNGNRCCERDLGSDRYNGRESKTEFRNREWNSCELSNNGKKSVSANDKIVSKAKKVETFSQNDTIFYLPNKFTSASSNHTVFPGKKNSQTLSTVNYKEQKLASNNLWDSTSHTIRNDDSIFYKGSNVSKSEYELPKISLNATVSSKDKTVSKGKKIEAVSKNDTIFYLPDKFTSASNSHAVFPSTKNSQTPLSVHYKDQSSASNILWGSTLHTKIRDDDGIFYKGSCEKGTYHF